MYPYPFATSKDLTVPLNLSDKMNDLLQMYWVWVQAIKNRRVCPC